VSRSTDADAVDAAMDALLRESWIGGCARSIAQRVRAAWIDSRVRRMLLAIGMGR